MPCKAAVIRSHSILSAHNPQNHSAISTIKSPIGLRKGKTTRTIYGSFQTASVGHDSNYISNNNVYMDVGQTFACDMRNTVHLIRRLVMD
jgi:hypothetical protein